MSLSAEHPRELLVRKAILEAKVWLVDWEKRYNLNAAEVICFFKARGWRSK